MKLCPLLNKSCIQGECMWWTEMIIKNVQTGEMATDSNCAVSKLPGLMVEQLRHTNGVQAAVESSRNESLVRQDALLNIVSHSRRAIGAPTE